MVIAGLAQLGVVEHAVVATPIIVSNHPNVIISQAVVWFVQAPVADQVARQHRNRIRSRRLGNNGCRPNGACCGARVVRDDAVNGH
ncbi:hypothetical protein SDC9_202656 [bioreactor metagenome]|uniref:Uncharacterized protein n=1 Tax=bioreactor metagenome TaxID=1076179 RepID=A0A645IV09_9ZZZZ